MVDLAKLDVAAALNLSVEQRAQLELLEAAWMPLTDLKELVEQRDALMAERTNLIETKRQQLSAAESRATAAEGRVALLEEALEKLLQANDDVQTVLCDGPEVPGFDPAALGKAQHRVTVAEAEARARLAKGEQ